MNNDFPVLNRAQQLKAINAELTSRTLLAELAKLPETLQERCFAKDKRAGFVFLYQSDKVSGYVLEVIQGFSGEDNAIALYESCSLLNDRQKLLNLRRDLIAALEEINDAGEGQLWANDPARGRKVLLGELATVQLVEMLKDARDKRALARAVQDASKA